MTYIEPDEFRLCYVMDVHLSKGGYGNVYSTVDGQYVVKLQGELKPPFSVPISTKSLVATINEINYYNRIDHPNIAKLEAWSYQPTKSRDGPKGGRTYMALRKGITVFDAIKAGQTTLLQVAKDLIS